MEIPNGMKQSLKRLHEDGTDTDVTLTAGGQQWKAHKLVLAMHSKKLHELAQNNHIVELKDTQPTHAAALVHFLYQMDYDATDEEPLHEVHVAMNKLAATYQIEDLVTLTVTKMAKLDMSYCGDECGVFLGKVYEEQSGVTKEMKRTIARLTFERDDSRYFIPEFFDECGELAYDMYEHICNQMFSLRMKLYQYKEYKHCLPFRADFSKMMVEDIKREAKVTGDWEEAEEYMEKKQIACPYCGETASMRLWMTTFLDESANYN